MHDPKSGDFINGRRIARVELYDAGLLRLWYESGPPWCDMFRVCGCEECREARALGAGGSYGVA